MNKISNLIEYKTRQQEIFTALGDKLSALSSPVRLKLIHFLSQAPLSVEVLAEKIEQTIANTSMHLRKMLNEDIVSVSHVGQKRVYTLNSAVKIFWEDCQHFLGLIQPSMVDLVKNEDLEINWPHSLTSSINDIKNKKVFLLDIRPHDEVFTDESLPSINYIHIPFEKLQEQWKKLPKKIPLLVICRGKYCALSTQAISFLKEKKIQAYRLPYSWFSISNKLKELL